MSLYMSLEWVAGRAKEDATWDGGILSTTIPGACRMGLNIISSSFRKINKEKVKQNSTLWKDSKCIFLKNGLEYLCSYVQKSEGVLYKSFGYNELLFSVPSGVYVCKIHRL